MSSLPESSVEARRRAAPRAVLRVVAEGEPVDRLPESADAFVGAATPPPLVVLAPVLLAAASVGFVWLVTVNAWDHEGFFPWFWNVLWTIFPWVFLLPLWIILIRSLARKPAKDRLRRSYRTQRDALPRSTGRIADVQLSRSENGGVSAYLASVAVPGGDFIVARLAPGSSFAAYEAPVAGDPVSVWRLDEGWILVQAAQRRLASAPQQEEAAVEGAESLPDQLARLARLHGEGALTDDEFEAAKRRVLRG